MTTLEVEREYGFRGLRFRRAHGEETPPHIRIGKSVFYDRDDVEAFIAARKHQKTPAKQGERG